MDLNDIVVFTKVVETKSFTGAAEHSGLPKSTVSRKLAQLEERLGVRLVQRTTRKLALTDIGEAYYERCAAHRRTTSLAAEQLVTDMQSTPRGRLRMTAPVDFSTRYLGDDRRRASSRSIPTSTSSSRRPTGRRPDRGGLRPRGPVRADAGVDADRAPAVLASSPCCARRRPTSRSAARRRRSRSSTSTTTCCSRRRPRDPELDAAQRRPDLRVRPPGAVREQQLRRGARRRARGRRHRAALRLHGRATTSRPAGSSACCPSGARA